MRLGRTLLLAALLVGLAGALPARAVIIASGDGTGNTTAPADDFGFANVGELEGLSGVYVGNGWVLTANHVGVGSLRLDGADYAAAEGEGVRLETAPGEPADLLLFRLVRDPGLPSLPIAEATPSVGESVRKAGNGRNRGPATTWRGIDGWEYGNGKTIRWGSNRVAEVGREDLGTRTFTTDFTELQDAASTAHEAQSARGDSGGGTFVPLEEEWALAGIQLAILTFQNQPSGTALYGNVTIHADLAFYSEAIANVVAVSACEDGEDNDGDGYVDGDDPGCASSEDAFETDAEFACDDGIDNDGDGQVDSADPGCAFPTGPTESPECDDGEDNDGDGLVDFGEDPECGSPADDREASGRCGLLGLEGLVVVAGLRRWRGESARRTGG